MLPGGELHGDSTLPGGNRDQSRFGPRLRARFGALESNHVSRCSYSLRVGVFFGQNDFGGTEWPRRRQRRNHLAQQLQPYTGCAAGVCDPERTQGLRAPAPVGTHDLVTLNGPGVFLGAAVSKQGGTNDLTFVILDIDGRNVVNLSYAAATNEGLTQQNPYGLVLLHSSASRR